MRRATIGLLLLLYMMSGCQQYGIKNIGVEQVVDNHNQIENLDGLNRFIDKVKKGKEAKVNFVSYGIEGQRMVERLIFNGKQINISASVDGDSLEEYMCKDIFMKVEETEKKYILSECTGSSGESDGKEILTVPNE
ncbi:MULTISPECIES: DUF4362 domain-containing protein [Bacillaceae]|uniref:DUF4362 domain-containing protein n=1 Tax=Bacillaceae TaxID=186817 RepID=UPI001E61046F|nr:MULTISPECIES: DUF4362 domain-containing protein [Bacillaceae]MCE4047346.1 DUF4362 domain-containing protein [Bacillus sp. Au-Bac7]MDL0437147.1 DUF4362 domain-containing protein [Niallia sp. SS-2023]UPO86296.1 DUF4362 domain-containing protein [Niallia sp. Man26]